MRILGNSGDSGGGTLESLTYSESREQLLQTGVRIAKDMQYISTSDWLIRMCGCIEAASLSSLHVSVCVVDVCLMTPVII